MIPLQTQYTWEIAPCQEGAGFTLREKHSGQLMHSIIGPWAEANQVYIAQSELERRTLTRPDGSPLVIFDVGLGIAANSLAAISTIVGLPGARRPVEIYSFERYPEALRQAVENSEKFGFLKPHLESIKTLLNTGTWNSADSLVQWKLIEGDFTTVDLSLIPPAELVYFDFYAPAICPELWTRAIFSKLRPSVRSDIESQALVITYASSKAIRSAMLLAGFFVGDGVSLAMKQQTTVSAPIRDTLKTPLPKSWLERLSRSSKPLPIDCSGASQEETLRLIRSHPQFRS